MELASHGFGGNDRFQLVRVLGRGGMGVVYEALDLRDNRTVALKLLPNITPDRLLRFKREFRAATELHHENLVRLHELIGTPECWFFTMELVHGEDILSYVRGYPVSREREEDVDPLSVTSASDATAPASMSTAVPLDPTEELRLRRCLAQLASGLRALHEAGSIHRDVKPSNVLVTREGRVVLLDFGLASLSSHDTTLFGAGTPLYMAPEQANGPVTMAADWYAFGVLMFELLTGTLPFHGAPQLVLLAKQGGSAPVVRARNSAAPRDLASLCDALLSVSPEHRPSGNEILQCLRRTDSGLRETPVRNPPRVSSVLGREREERTLEITIAEVRRNERPIAMMVRGDSGIGKSTLVRGFADALLEQRAALVFSGRCYERELVPYKAIDDIFDALSQWLRHQRSSEVEALLPRHAGVLAQVFPVLARVSALARADRPAPTVDPQELRTALFGAARELLVNIARQHPLLLVIDDLHWADRDSLALLSDVCASHSPARIMLLCTVRTNMGADDRLLAPSVDERALALGALSESSSALLAEQLLRAADLEGVDAVRVGAESGGHPLFLRELVRQLASPGDRPEVLTLESMLRDRMSTMSPSAQRALRSIALAGAPRAAAVIGEATGLDADALAAARAELRAAGFLHVSGYGERELLDVSHDRVRHAARSELDPEEARALHARLAEILARQDDSAGAAVHFRDAGEPVRAARHHLRAAERASAAFAFVDSVGHFQAALALGSFAVEQRQAVRVQLADALSNAGRGRAAAELYRLAAQHSEPALALELKRRAARELTRSGYLEEGRQVAGEVLAQAGLGFARVPLFGLVLRRIQIRLRGLRYRERQALARRLERIDLVWSLSTALVMTDHIQGAYLQARGLLLALRAGDAARVARAIAAEAAFYAGFGARAQPRVYRLIDRAEATAARLGEPRLIASVSLMAGIAAHLGGRFAEAKSHLERADSLLRERCAGAWWELDSCKQFWLESCFYLGELTSFPEAVSTGLKEAEERGLLYAQANLRTGLPNAGWLIRDEPERAVEASANALKQWSRRGFHVQHWYQLVSDTQAELYLGHGKAAHARVEAGWPGLRRSHLRRISHTQIIATHLRARAALAAARETQDRGPLLELARKLARRLEREKALWASALAGLIRTSADNLAGQPPSTTRLSYLRGMLERSDLKLYALAIDTLQAEGAASGLARCGVSNPQAFARMLLPGLA
jgi:eukaryotic-like serine/threonine-protein kinase